MDRNLNENDKHKIGKNDHDARELHTYADNHADLHRQRITPIHKNLRNKMAQGKYDHDKAHKAFSYAAKDAADRYKKEHGHTFSKADRDKVAGHMRDQFHDEAKDGHHDHHLHKKYKGHKVESVQHDLEESNASLLKKFQSNIKDFQSFGKASGMSPRDVANMTKQLMSIHGMLKKGDVRGAKKMSTKLGGVASDIIPAKLMREDVQLDEKFDLARRALVNAGVPHMGERKVNKLKVHSKFKDTAQNVMKKFKGLDLEINDRMPEKPLTGMDKRISKMAMPKEDVEQVDELDAGTLIRYNNKASAQVTRDLKTAQGKHTPKTNKRMKGILKARKKLDKIMPGLRAEEVSEEMTDAQMNKKERIVKAMKEKRPQSYFMKKYGKDGKDVMYATATKLAMKDHVEWEEIRESDEKPLMRWFAQFEREIKKHGMKYKSVDPVKMLKLYYRNVNPKNAAAVLSGKGKGSEADYAAMEAVETPPDHHATDDSSHKKYKRDNSKSESTASDMANFDKMKKQREAEAKRYGFKSMRAPEGGAMGEDVDHDLEEEKKDPRLSIVTKKVTKLEDKERDLLASAINMSGGAAGAPMANRANVDKFNDGVIIPAMTFLRKNMSSLTPEGKKLGKKILKVLGESVENPEYDPDLGEMNIGEDHKNCGCGQDPCITYGSQNEALGDEDKPTVKKIIKKLKGASQAHAGQAKDLEKAMNNENVSNVADWITFMKRNA